MGVSGEEAPRDIGVGHGDDSEVRVEAQGQAFLTHHRPNDQANRAGTLKG